MYANRHSTVLANEDKNWYQLMMKIFTGIDPKVRKTIIENFIINASVKGMKRQNELKVQNNCDIPWAILMDTTSACNLHCTGCWATEYGNKLNLSPETWDSIIELGKQMGVYMFIYSGGEPLVRKKDIIRMCERHNDCIFLAFINGTLINEDFADEMLRVKILFRLSALKASPKRLIPVAEKDIMPQ